MLDFIKAKQYKKNAEDLQEKVDVLESLLTPELKDIDSQKKKIAELEADIASLDSSISEKEQRIIDLDSEIADKESRVVTFDDAILVQNFGLYEPRFDFADSSQFKDALKECRARQKEMVKEFDREAGETTWRVNNSIAEGRKLVKQISKLIMRAYNGECDEIVRKVKTSNVDRSIQQVHKSENAINKLGTVIGVSIPPEYAALKEKEVRLAYEFALQKEKEKEELRELRAQEREERKLAQEIAAARKKLEKERKQYLAAYRDASKRLGAAPEKERADLQEKVDELRRKLDDVDAAVKDVDYREANQKAGFVYIISNVGSFGEGVYKIGMTRRLEPMERIRELGDASVPFSFDVHAMIFCDDAPKLEAALHREFESRKMNLVNTRREFFRASLAEIEEVVKKNYDKTVEFKEVPDADQYRISEKMRSVR